MAKLTITDPNTDEVVMEANGTKTTAVMTLVTGGIMVIGYGLGKTIECVGKAVKSLMH